jgi:hypothetical protein
VISYHLRDIGGNLVTTGYICYREKEPCDEIMEAGQSLGCRMTLVILSVLIKDHIVVCPCNTPGVCHPLRSGFELKHDRLSGDEEVNVKPMEMSPNLNLDIVPLLYI